MPKKWLRGVGGQRTKEKCNKKILYQKITNGLHHQHQYFLKWDFVALQK
jgi:hypothetical protein